MDKILLIGRRNAETVNVRNDLFRANPECEVTLADRAVYAIQQLKLGLVNLVVFNVEVFSRQKIKLATDMRDLGYDFPVLVLAKIIAPDILNQIDEMKNTVLLETPYERKDLKGITHKLIEGSRCSQRIFRRFYTNQNARIKPENQKDVIAGKMYNLSKGGAYCEYPGAESLKRGDVVQLDLELSQVDRRYRVSSRVVWTTKEGMWSGNPGVGVEFLQEDDVYRNALGRF